MGPFRIDLRIHVFGHPLSEVFSRYLERKLADKKFVGGDVDDVF